MEVNKQYLFVQIGLHIYKLTFYKEGEALHPFLLYTAVNMFGSGLEAVCF